MTQELKAGKALDALIAERVMGRETYWHPDGLAIRETADEMAVRMTGGPMFCPHYSTDISAAWEVVQKTIDYEAASTDYDRITNRPTIHKWELWFGERGRESVQHGKAYAPTAPLAICLAALKAIGRS